MKSRAILWSLTAFCLAATLIATQDAKQVRLQRVVTDAMMRIPGTQGVALVLDVQSGRILASHRLDAAALTLETPGSVIKPFTLMAMLENGVVRPKTTVMCRKNVRLAGRNLDCSHVDVPEPIDGTLAIAYSCNYFFTHMAEMLSPETLTNTLRQAGLASRTGLASGEVAGAIERPGTREDLQLMAIGEGGIRITPLALAAAYRKLALRAKQGDSTISPIVDGLTGAVQYGTAQRAGIKGTVVAGKTGSSPSQARPGTHAWFAGFAPADRPETVVVVYVDRGTGGSDAAPIAGQIFEALR